MREEIDLSKSQAELNRRFANNPVISNAATSTDEALYSSGVGGDFGGDAAPAGPSSSKPFDYAREFGIGSAAAAERAKVAVSAPAAAPALAPRIDESALRPRIEDAGNGVRVPQGTGIISEAASGSAGPARDYGTELRAMQARDAQSAQTAYAQNAAGNRAAQNSFDAANAAQAARVSNFRATQGADVVLATENSGYDQQRGAIIAQAAADKKVAGELAGNARADGIASTANTQDFAKENALAQEGITRSRIAGVAEQRDVIGAQAEKLKLEQQKRINDLSSTITNETDPKKREAATKNLLALMGKDPKKNFQALPISLPDTVDPTTGAVMKGGQAIAIVGEDGSREIVKMDGGAGATKGDPIAEAKAAVAKGADKNKVNERLKSMGLQTI